MNNLIIFLQDSLASESVVGWLFLFGLGLMIFLGTRHYYCRQHRRAMVAWRIKVSADLHDEVGTELAGLAMKAELLATLASSKDQGALKHIAEKSRQTMAQMRDTVWAIDARKNNLVRDNGQVRAKKPFGNTGLGVSNMYLRTRNLGGKIQNNRHDGFGVSLTTQLAD